MQGCRQTFGHRTKPNESSKVNSANHTESNPLHASSCIVSSGVELGILGI